jgi:hypothetical protein
MQMYARHRGGCDSHEPCLRRGGQYFAGLPSEGWIVRPQRPTSDLSREYRERALSRSDQIAIYCVAQKFMLLHTHADALQHALAQIQTCTLTLSQRNREAHAH